MPCELLLTNDVPVALTDVSCISLHDSC